MKADQLDWKTLLIIALDFQNDFALLRYLLFHSVENIFSDDNSASHWTIQPTNKPNPNPNLNPDHSRIFADTLPTTVDEPLTFCFTAEGAVGPPITKPINSSSTSFQLSVNTREAPATTMKNLTPKIFELEKLFAAEIGTYTSITAGLHSQYFFLYDKNHKLEAGNSDYIVWKILSVKFVFDYAAVTRPSSDPLIQSATSFGSPVFKTNPYGYNFFTKFYP